VSFHLDSTMSPKIEQTFVTSAPAVQCSGSREASGTLTRPGMSTPVTKRLQFCRVDAQAKGSGTVSEQFQSPPYNHSKEENYGVFGQRYPRDLVDTTHSDVRVPTFEWLRMPVCEAFGTEHNSRRSSSGELIVVWASIAVDCENKTI
jgi:hypothetical protein